VAGPLEHRSWLTSFPRKRLGGLGPDRTARITGTGNRLELPARDGHGLGMLPDAHAQFPTGHELIHN
jgi:hypothetical protein